METITQDLIQTERELDEVLDIIVDKCELCGEEIDMEDEMNYYEFDDGKKWCMTCFANEKLNF
jgi:hypothetical protein